MKHDIPACGDKPDLGYVSCFSWLEAGSIKTALSNPSPNGSREAFACMPGSLLDSVILPPAIKV